MFLCASALESTRLLLLSGFADASGQLGRNLMDHTMGGGAGGTIPGYEDQWVYGNRPNGIYLPRFRNVKTEHPDFLRGYAFQGGAGRSDWGRGNSMEGFGAELKTSLRTPGPWRFSFYGFGECLPNPDNYIDLDPQVKDKWGIPALRIHCAWRENERKMLQDMSVTAAEMLEAAGAMDIKTFVAGQSPRTHDPRDGHGANGPRPGHVGAQRPQPVPRRGQCVRDGRRLHGLLRQPEPVHHLHGAHRPGDGLRG